MPEPILGFACRNQIREVLTQYTVERIERYFCLGNFFPDDTHVSTVIGEQRILVEQYFAAIDFTSIEEVNRFFLVLEEIIHDLQPSQNRFPWQHPSDLAEEHNERLQRFLKREGVELIEGHLRIAQGVVETGLTDISEQSILRYVNRAKQRLTEEDYPAAITISYTLVESFLKTLLRNLEVEFRDTQGDIRQLYNDLKEPMQLNPAGQNIESYVRIILDGLQKIVAGLYDLANNAGDRHAGRYEPDRHHAQLAVNAAFTLCEYLLAVWEAQQADGQ